MVFGKLGRLDEQYRGEHGCEVARGSTAGAGVRVNVVTGVEVQ